jgi:ABC-type cobalamin transport system ATPase subunit
MTETDFSIETLIVEEPQRAKALAAISKRAQGLLGQQQELLRAQSEVTQQLTEVNDFLAISDAVTDALDKLSHDVFQRQLSDIEKTITKALQDVLDQPIEFEAVASFKNNATSVDFSILRGGNQEDIMRGQGGSVANVVSVGLRLFAIATLDQRRHRKFLVLDEQDCWLHPSLVPRLTKIVQEAGTALGFQVLMISHHDVSNFLRHADRVYRLAPDRGEGVRLELVTSDEIALQQRST